MRAVIMSLFCLLLITGQALAEEMKQPELATEMDKISYALGMQMGSYLQTLGEDLDTALLIKGLEDSYKGEKQLLTKEEEAQILQGFAQKQQEKQIQQTVEMITKNKKAADDFLQANSAKEGVKTTTSGLQYQVISEGDGPKPKAEDIVKVHYKGTLLDGTEFDSSYSRNEPAVFPLDKVIPGWTEGVQLMNVGSKYKFFLPPDLAYGDRGAMPVIEPGSMLVFEVELLGIENPEQETPPSQEK